MTLGCLAPYRRLGIGTKMLEHVLNVVKEDGSFSSIFLHVQINNTSAIEFYKRFGFNIVETKEQYYKVEHLSLEIFIVESCFSCVAEDRTSRCSCLGKVLENREAEGEDEW